MSLGDPTVAERADELLNVFGEWSVTPRPWTTNEHEHASAVPKHPVIPSEGQRRRCTWEKKHGAGESRAIAGVDARRRVGQSSPWLGQGYSS